MVNGTDETKVMYWCDTCKEWRFPGKYHDGIHRKCDSKANCLIVPPIYRTLEYPLEKAS